MPSQYIRGMPSQYIRGMPPLGTGRTRWWIRHSSASSVPGIITDWRNLLAIASLNIFPVLAMKDTNTKTNTKTKIRHSSTSSVPGIITDWRKKPAQLIFGALAHFDNERQTQIQRQIQIQNLRHSSASSVPGIITHHQIGKGKPAGHQKFEHL